MKLSYSAAWDDVTAQLRAHGPLLAAIAGAFLFLPGLLLAYFAPQPRAATMAELVPLLIQYMQHNLGWVVLVRLVSLLGILSILKLVFAPRGTTVAAAIASAARLTPTYFVALALASLAIGIGFVLLVVPGVYIAARVATLGPVIAAEDRLNPFQALARAVAATKGNGWRIVGLFALVALAGVILVLVINTLIGLLLILIAGRDAAALLSLILGGAMGTVLETVLILLTAAVYRALAPGAAASTGSERPQA